MSQAKLYCITTILILTFITFCKAQNDSIEFPIQDFEFDTHFGYRIGGNKNDIYCLLGQGFFTTPRSSNLSNLLQNWLKKHPNAKLIPISFIEDQYKITYCWIEDGNENLNIYLIKNGCYPGGTMLRPKTWKEMNRKEKKLYRGTEKPNIEVLVKDNLYKKFIQELIDAEEYAKENKLGIWNKK